jgi:hypothetical protein
MRNKLTYLVSAAILAVLSPLAAAQSPEGTMLADKRFWQGPDSAKIEARVAQRSQRALDSLERQRGGPHSDSFGGSRGHSGGSDSSSSAGGSSGSDGPGGPAGGPR